MNGSEYSPLSTEQLESLIRSSPEACIDRLSDKSLVPGGVSLPGYVKQLMAVCDMDAAALVMHSQLSKTYVYQILSGERQPARDTLIRLALAMRCGLEATQRMLTIGKQGVLYPKVRRDAAIMCCVEQKAPLTDADAFLVQLGEAPLL